MRLQGAHAYKSCAIFNASRRVQTDMSSIEALAWVHTPDLAVKLVSQSVLYSHCMCTHEST